LAAPGDRGKSKYDINAGVVAVSLSGIAAISTFIGVILAALGNISSYIQVLPLFVNLFGIAGALGGAISLRKHRGLGLVALVLGLTVILVWFFIVAGIELE
jgi:hypothetical protein